MDDLKVGDIVSVYLFDGYSDPVEVLIVDTEGDGWVEFDEQINGSSSFNGDTKEIIMVHYTPTCFSCQSTGFAWESREPPH